MILPTNGRVVVIDDDPGEGLALVRALSRNNISVKYFDGTQDELPDLPLKEIRIVFLDIVLGTEGQNIKTKVSKAVNVLKKAIDILDTIPFILVAWTKEKNLINPLIAALKPSNPILVDLEKYECKKNGDYDVAVIEDKLKEKCGDFKSLTAFLFWENLVNNCAGEIYDDFTSFYQIDAKWDVNLKRIIYSLAEAFAGIDRMKDSSMTDCEKLRNAMFGINGVLIDTLESTIQRDSLVDVGTITDASVDNKAKSKINTKMHLFKYSYTGYTALHQTGDLYLKSNKHIVNEIVSGNAQSNIDEIINSKPKLVELDITPRCDYAQSKGYTRLLSGIMLEDKFKKRFKNNALSYRGCPIMSIKNKDYYLLFDYRFFKSLTTDEIKKRKTGPKYRIRHELVVDIQASFSNHINRFGVTCIE